MTSDSRPSSSLPVAFAAMITIGLCCLSLLRFPDGETPGLLLFFGRFHPVVLHAPIGLLLALVLVEVAAPFHSSAELARVRTVLLWITALSSAVTVVLGSLLALGGGYDETTLFRHRWLGVGLCLAVVWALVVRRRRVLYRLLLAGGLGLMGAAGHYGGSLTHGADYLFRYMPDGLRAMIGLPLPEPAPTESVYATQIQPIFDRYCIKCHGATKQKGDLRLDSFAELMAAGVVTPGDPAGSLLLQMLRFPLDDLDHMPPEDKPQPSPDQVAAIEAWIAAGAPGPDEKI